MELYLAGYGRGDASFSDADYFLALFCFHKSKLFSYYYDKTKFKKLIHHEDKLFKDYYEKKITPEHFILRLVNNPVTKTYVKESDMNIYLAGGECRSWITVMVKGKFSGTLMPYFYLHKTNRTYDDIIRFIHWANKKRRRIFMDSGAFSAMTKNAKIDIDEYCAWLMKYKDALTVYAGLDVIGDWKGTLKNQEYMEKKGLEPLWCFHFTEDNSEPYELLNDMCQKYKYIALGGIASKIGSREDKVKHLDRCWNIISKYKIKVHGFGITATAMLRRYPWYSVDSTGWLSGSMRATVFKFDQKKGDFDLFDMTREDDFKKIGDMSLVDTDGVKNWMNRVIYNVIEFNKMEKYMTELWSRRGVKYED